MDLAKLLDTISHSLCRATDEHKALIQLAIEESLADGVSPKYTKRLYEIMESAKKITLEEIHLTKPPGPPTITHAAPSPQGPGGEVDDPLAEDST